MIYVGFGTEKRSVVTGVEMFRKLLDQGQAGDNVGLLLRGVRKDEVGFWIGPQKLVFTVTSSTGRRFYVVASRGTLKLPAKNLGDLAFVF